MNMKNKYSNFVLNKMHKVIRSLKRTNEEGGSLRHSRLRKFGKRGRKLALLAQIAAIWYLSFAMISYLTTDTGAYFNDVEVIENTLGVCPDFEWTDQNCNYPEGWDKSSLKFIGESKGEGNSCPPITATIQNGKGSRDMEGKVKYEVYWIESGNPKNGVKLSDGDVPALDAGEKYVITYQPDKNGNYMFKAYQRPNHPGKGELWSNEISVNNCKSDEQSGGPQEVDQDEEENDEGKQEGEQNEGQKDEGKQDDEQNEEGQQEGEQKPEDKQAPSDVTKLKGEISGNQNGNGNKDITLSWVNPTDLDFSHVNIYDESNPGTKINKDKIVENSITLKSKVPVTYRVTTVDKSENESKGVLVTIEYKGIE